jgi:translocation and assembly module TamA
MGTTRREKAESHGRSLVLWRDSFRSWLTKKTMGRTEMASAPKRGTLGGLLLALTAFAAPASAFELFGYQLWGAREPEDQIEIIDPLPYTLTMNISGADNALERQIENASSLWTDRETPASGTGGLLSKARGDYRRLLAALYAAGYYGPVISIRAAGQEVADLTLAVEFPPNVPVVVDVQTGPRFNFGVTGIVNAPPPTGNMRDEVDTPASIGFRPGQPARSGVINQASALSVERWRQLARAKAREADREVIADHATNRLDATLVLDPGRAATYGPVEVVGSQRVNPDFIRFMVDLPEGASFDPDDIDAAQARLTRLGVFSSLRFEEADEIRPDGSLPITVRVEDRRRRTIGAGATLSTIDGLGVAAFWVNRNMFGRAEQLRFDAGIDGLGGSLDPNDYDYNLGVTFTRPGVYTPDTNFVTSLVGQQVDFDTYRERSVTASAGFTQLFGDDLTGSLFLQASRARYEDDFGVRHFSILSLVGAGQYDRRDDPLNATRGYYVAATAEPFYEAEFGNVGLQTTLEGRVYRGFGEDRRIVLAGRALVGSFFGPDVEESPPDMLFFAGGGGSVRGYPYRSIGVENIDTGEEDPFVVGGAGLLEASGELRYRINDRFGAVGFVDSGLVTENPSLSGESTLKTGAGLGVRYYTGIGVLRFDLAAPLQPDPDDSAVAFYIGIGQAF